MLRGIQQLARQQCRSMLRSEKGALPGQKRFMSGDDEPGVHRVAWWDAPQDPNIWQKHHLAWWTVGFYSTLYWLVAGGSKKEEPVKASA